ncbi:MAG TPA: hypothetical protein VFJ58_17825 [Armatimonadota bacterium]|nr:hypothetical protein [Armatimonadota bacterium]
MSQSNSLEEPGGTACVEHTIEVYGISETLLQRLDQRARESGTNRSQVIQAILSKELGEEGTDPASRRFDAALAPIRQGFAENGLSEDEATALLEAGLSAVRQEKRSGNPHRQSRERRHKIRESGTGTMPNEPRCSAGSR